MSRIYMGDAAVDGNSAPATNPAVEYVTETRVQELIAVERRAAFYRSLLYSVAWGLLMFWFRRAQRR